MPGSVANASPSTVLPYNLCTAFVEIRQYPMVENEYRNGESQRTRQADTSRKAWQLTQRLTPAQLQALRTFFDARKGPTEPFYFYNPWETNPKFQAGYDPTGATTQGRHTVRFANSEWSESIAPGRAEVSIELIELA